MSQSLSPTAKRTILTGLGIGALILLYSVRDVLPPFVLALVLAYILNPLVVWLMRVSRRSRTTVVVVVYVGLVIALILVIVLITPTLVRQVRAINIDLETISNQIRQWLDDYQQVEVAGFSLDLLALSGEIRSAVQSVIAFLAARTGSVLLGVLSGLVWTILILFVSFYILKDADSVGDKIRAALPSAYHADVDRLVAEVNGVLSDYLRGQLALALVVGIVTGTVLAMLGVRNALLLGVLAGILEVIPTIGPTLAAIPAIAIAFFQGSAHLSLDRHWFALLVTAAYVVIQQLENNILVPRIIGHSVNLHPALVIFAALAGATLAGVVGMFLAIPTVAIGRVLVGYLYAKLRE